MKKQIKNKLMLTLTLAAINSTTSAMMTTVSQQAPAIGRAAAPAVGAMMPSILANYNRQNNNNNATMNEYNFTPKYSVANQNASTMPNFSQQYTNKPYSQGLLKQQIATYQNAQAHQGPIVNLKQAFANDQNELSYNPFNDSEFALDSMNDTSENQPQLKKLNPNISIAQNLYGRNSDFGKSPFTIQQRNYSTFKPKSNNPYDVLGVSSSSTPEQIKTAYLKLVQQYHPDVNQNNKKEATQDLQKINNAYDQLNKPNQIFNNNYASSERSSQNSTVYDSQGYDQNGAEYKSKNQQSFKEACDYGTEETIKNYITKNNIDINQRFVATKDEYYYYYYNMLGEAITHMKLSKVKLAIKLGADVNTNGVDQEIADKDSRFTTSPLLQACQLSRDVSYHEIGTTKDLIIMALLQAGANVNVIDAAGNSPLLTLIKKEFIIPDWLKQNNYSVQEHFITDEAYKNVIKELIQKGADVNHANNKGETPLSEVYRLSLAYKGYYKTDLKKDPKDAERYKLKYKIFDECAEILTQAGAQEPIDTRSTWEKIKQNWF